MTSRNALCGPLHLLRRSATTLRFEIGIHEGVWAGLVSSPIYKLLFITCSIDGSLLVSLALAFVRRISLFLVSLHTSVVPVWV